MRMMKSALVAVAVVVIAGGMNAWAQQPGAAQQPEPSVASGQLQKVDSTAKTIVIRTEAGSPMQFSYTDDTKVSGADKGVAGLATMTGTPVTIRYTKKDQVNVATQIEIQAAKR